MPRLNQDNHIQTHMYTNQTFGDAIMWEAIPFEIQGGILFGLILLAIFLASFIISFVIAMVLTLGVVLAGIIR